MNAPQQAQAFLNKVVQEHNYDRQIQRETADETPFLYGQDFDIEPDVWDSYGESFTFDAEPDIEAILRFL